MSRGGLDGVGVALRIRPAISVVCRVTIPGMARWKQGASDAVERVVLGASSWIGVLTTGCRRTHVQVLAAG